MKNQSTDSPAYQRYCQMEVVCPRCRGQGLVAWNRLDRLLHCGVCGAWCRVDDQGKLVEAAPPKGFWVYVSSSFSVWKRVRVLLGSDIDGEIAELRRGRRQMTLLSVAVIGVALLCGTGIGWALVQSKQSIVATPIAAETPTSLEARATSWAEAWLAEDTARLLQLIERSHDRSLRRWLSKNRPPKSLATATDVKPQITFTSTPRSDDQRLCDVTLTIALPEEPLALQQLWYQRDGTWYFWSGL